MGSGYSVVCEKCGYRTRLYVGAGMMLPYLAGETKKKAQRGFFGKETAELVMAHPTGAFDCETAVYACGCGAWTCEDRMDYVVNKDESVELPYVPYGGMSKGMRCIREGEHICRKCGEKMSEINFRKTALKCPECGARMKLGPSFCWD